MLGTQNLKIGCSINYVICHRLINEIKCNLSFQNQAWSSHCKYLLHFERLKFKILFVFNRSYKGKNILQWIYFILVNHGHHLLSQESLTPMLSSLYKVRKKKLFASAFTCFILLYLFLGWPAPIAMSYLSSLPFKHLHAFK